MEEIETIPRRPLAEASLIRQLFNRLFMILILLLLTLPAFSQNAPASEAIIAQENAFWKAYTTGNVSALATFLQPGFTNVEQEIWTRNQVLTFVQRFHQQCSLAPVVLVDTRVSFLAPDIATIVYHANEVATCGTRTMTGDTNVSTVWVRRDGRWQMHLHSEYPIPAK
jgi:uncharacterized protein (TIGR02246 family)